MILYIVMNKKNNFDNNLLTKHYIIECYTNEKNRCCFDFGLKTDEWDMHEIINKETKKTTHYVCKFNKLADYNTALDMTMYSMENKQMVWKYEGEITEDWLKYNTVAKNYFFRQ
jgi:hypothetical protein